MDDERVYIPIAPEHIVALSRSNGATLWTRDIESMWPPVVIGDSIFVAAGDGIHALASETGDPKWRVSFDHKVLAPLGAPPASLIGTFDKGLVIAFAPDTGRTPWMRRAGPPA